MKIEQSKIWNWHEICFIALVIYMYNVKPLQFHWFIALIIYIMQSRCNFLCFILYCKVSAVCSILLNSNTNCVFSKENISYHSIWLHVFMKIANSWLRQTFVIWVKSPGEEVHPRLSPNQSVQGEGSPPLHLHLLLLLLLHHHLLGLGWIRVWKRADPPPLLWKFFIKSDFFVKVWLPLERPLF